MTIVRSEIFKRFPEILFGMSTNSGGVSSGTLGLNLSFHVNDNPDDVKENRKRFFAQLGISEDHVAFTRQQHTVNIVTVNQSGINENCDALITGKRNIFLSISVADCTPVMLYDPRENIIAGIHAGWRGTAGRITEKTVLQLKNDYNCDPAEIVAFIGPSAGKCCYEVGEEVASQFPERCSSVLPNGKYLLDVKLANAIQLLECGVRNSNIEVHKECTIENGLYHSHRRDGKGSGRMLAIIGMTK
jgi:YfiH family protein